MAHRALWGSLCVCVCACRQGQWHTGSTPEVCALESGQRTVEGEGGSGACEPSINVMYFSTADLCSQEQPLGTRPHICLSYDLTEGQQSPSSSLSPTAELGLDPKGPPGWSLSDTHIPSITQPGWAEGAVTFPSSFGPRTAALYL